MQDGFWDRLAAPFVESATEWRAIERSEDGERVRLRPQLRYVAVLERLDGVVGRLGWSNRYLPWGDAIICELSVAEVTKSVVLGPVRGQDLAQLAEDALVRAAERFGLCPGADPAASYWALADSESGLPLHEPELPDAPQPPSAPAEKPAGQQAIDRLMERLRQEGQGLAAARLVTEYQGYGANPEAARELYAKLRALLLAAGTGSQA